MNQLIIILFYVCLSAGFYLVIINHIESSYFQLLLFIIHSVVILGVTYLWLYIELSDTEDYKLHTEETVTHMRPIKCFYLENHIHDENKTHYCRECRKYIAGLDHHCTWLNTCIGSVNYRAFILLIQIATFQFYLQCGVGLYCIEYISNEEEYSR